MTCVLSLDPGFEWLGWSIVELRPAPSGLVIAPLLPRLVDMGLHRTQKSNKKLNVRDADDNFHRWRSIADAVAKHVESHSIAAICMEAYSPVRSSSVAAKLGGVYGVLAAIGTTRKLPCVSISPQAVRRHMDAASKGDVEAVVRSRFADGHSRRVMGRFESLWPELQRVHAWDSLGVFIACENSDVLLALARS